MTPGQAQAHVNADVKDFAQDRPSLLKVAAEAAFPAAYLADLERLSGPHLRICLADLSHLLMPLLSQRAERAQAAVAVLVQNQVSAASTQAALHAVGATTVVHLQTGSLPTATEDYRKFAAAIGAPPNLPGLTAAESLMFQGARQLSNLAASSRLGVGLAALAVSERVWQWMTHLLGNMVARRDGVVSVQARAYFSPERRDANLADDLAAMAGELPEAPLIERSIGFGAEQAAAVLGPMFAVLHSRQQQWRTLAS
jgi:hypothetical protein